MERKGCFFALLAGVVWATMGGLGVVLGSLGLTPYEIFRAKMNIDIQGQPKSEV